MAPSKRAAAKKPKSSPSSPPGDPPQPFKRAPEVMEPFFATLSKKHVYITHIDNKSVDFKRKIFAVPVVINLVIAALFVLRMWYILPWYFQLVVSGLGHNNETTVDAAGSSWGAIAQIVVQRAFSFLLDFLLFIFVWPWPVEFCFGMSNGSPLSWRWSVGFRDREVYVRRSKPNWDTGIKKAVSGDDVQARTLFLTNVGDATAPMLVNEKTGYLTQNNEWDLDWAAMVTATKLVDKKTIALDAFKLMVVLYHEDYGWVSLDHKLNASAQEDERRNQVFAFRDALAAVGKEDLFYRWIEIVQFESTRPDGFGPEKQVTVAKQIRELFAEQGVDFDEFWKESVGTDGLANM